MGLFSSHKSTPNKVIVPPEILAEVSVNGEKSAVVMAAQKSTPVETPAQVASAPVATSPFLKPKASVSSAPLIAPQIVHTKQSPLGEVPINNSSQEKAIPKAFNFSDQAPLPGEIHFTDISSEKSKNQNLPVEPPLVSAPIPDFSHITQDKALTEKQKEHLSPMKVGAKGDTNDTKKSIFSPSNLLSLAVFILILVFISGGSWYYLNTRKTDPKVSDMSIGTMTPPTPIKAEAGTNSVLVDQPNYLKLDVETVTLLEVKSAIEKEGQKIVAGGITTPVEYLVVDTNNNPVAFSRFAFLVGVMSPNAVVDASLEPFSLYLYQDAGTLRIALAVTLAEGQGNQFSSNPPVVADSFKKFLYPDEVSVNSFTNETFRQSSHKGNIISYVNIDITKNFSFDMAVQEGILTFTNSKGTMRAVIDKRAGLTTE